MASHKPIPLTLTPGVVKNEGPVASQGRFSDALNVRFWNGRPQKWGGWVALTTQALIGYARGALTWNDLTARQLVAVGTHIKLYAISNADYTPVDITPWLSTQVVNNAIVTTNGSSIITVNVPSHGASIGQYIDISLAAAVGGVTPNGSFAIVSVVDANHVTVDCGTVATSGATGGGALTSISVELAPGFADPASGFGWGAGAWNAEAWNTPRSVSSISFDPRVWTFGHFGKILIGAVNEGGVYSWDPTTVPTPRATLIGTAPTKVTGLITTSDTLVIAYGTNFGGTRDLMQFWNSAQGDYTNWDTTAIAGLNGAPSRVNRLNEGTRIVGAVDLGVHIALMWTDTALYSLQYTGSQFVFNTQKVGSNCGLIGPHAKAVVGSEAFWFGPNGFYQFAGSVSQMPNSEDISEWWFSHLRLYFGIKAYAWYNQQFDEVYFAAVFDSDAEPGVYVCYSRKDQKWTNGKIVRTTATRFEAADSRPLLVGTDGILYEHDNGLTANGAAMPWTLSTDGIDVAQGDMEIDVRGIAMDMARQVGTITLLLSTYDRTNVGSPVVDTYTLTFGPADGLIDAQLSGRELSLDLSGGAVAGDDFRMGQPRLLGKAVGGRP